jgi:hypothetical protein
MLRAIPIALAAGCDFMLPLGVLPSAPGEIRMVVARNRGDRARSGCGSDATAARCGTPILYPIGDTLFVTARLELPDRGEATMLATVGLSPYEVMYGPLAAHSQLRITNRVGGQPAADIPALDTVIRIPSGFTLPPRVPAGRGARRKQGFWPIDVY